MTHEFDKDFWEQHWQERPDDGPASRPIEPNPYLIRETSDLPVGTALDAGCGEGDEAIWLAASGWAVTGADISIDALVRAADRAAGASSGMQLKWIEADLTQWEPGEQFDLVTTHYAHPSIPQLAFYDRLSRWVGPGGTLLIVGHLQGGGHGHASHGAAAVSLHDITARFAAPDWQILTAEEQARTLTSPTGAPVELHDVVVRAIRLH